MTDQTLREEIVSLIAMEIFEEAKEDGPISQAYAEARANAMLDAYARTHQNQLLKRLLSKKQLYNVKSLNGELVPPNTGIFAIPISEVEALIL